MEFQPIIPDAMSLPSNDAPSGGIYNEASGGLFATDRRAAQVGDILTDLGLEIEGIVQYQSVKGGLDGVVIGKILSCEKHQNADKLKVTKLAWEIKGARSVNNDLQIKEKFDFKRSAKDLLITSQVRVAMIENKKIKSVNYNIDTYKKKVYIYGIAQNKTERDQVTMEAKQVLDVQDVITSIFLVDDLRVVKN